MSMWVSRGIYGILWVFMRACACLWVFMGMGVDVGSVSMGIYVCLWAYANFCVSMGACRELWNWALSTHEVPRDTHEAPLTPIDTQNIYKYP